MKYVTAIQKAKETGLTRSSIKLKCNNGEIPGAIKIQGLRTKEWRIPADWLPEHHRLVASGEYERLSDASRRLGVGYNTLYKHAVAGEIPGAVKPKGSRWWLIPSDFEIEEGDQPAVDHDYYFTFITDDPDINLFYAVVLTAKVDTHSRIPKLREDAEAFLGDMQWIIELFTPGEDIRIYGRKGWGGITV